MTANPDFALRQALAALAPFAEFVGASKAPDNTIITQQYRDGSPLLYEGFTMGDFRRAREAHALITAALAQHNQEKP